MMMLSGSDLFNINSDSYGLRRLEPRLQRSLHLIGFLFLLLLLYIVDSVFPQSDFSCLMG